MTVPVVVSLVLTALAVVDIALTRLRMNRGERRAARRLDVPTSTLVDVHTVAGALAVVLWCLYLLASPGWPVGLAGLVLWWVAACAGLLILARWLPARGRHASDPAGDSWSQGPGLSMLAHLGLLGGCVVWTVYFVAGSL